MDAGDVGAGGAVEAVGTLAGLKGAPSGAPPPTAKASCASASHVTRGVGARVADGGWQRVVVTDRCHLRRAGLLVRRCPDGADAGARGDRLPRAAVALGLAVTAHRAG